MSFCRDGILLSDFAAKQDIWGKEETSFRQLRQFVWNTLMEDIPNLRKQILDKM